MAEEQIVTNIVANADFSNLIADVNRVTASLSEMQQKLAASNKALDNQIKVINTSFAETLRSTGQYSTHFLTLTSDVEKFGRNLDAGRLKLRDYFRVYQDHQKTSTGLIRDLAKQQTQLQNAILQPLGRNAQGLMQFNVHVPRGLDLIKNKTNLAKLELQIMNKVIQDGAVQLINWGKNTQWAGRQLTVGLTVPLAMFGKAAADAFRQADQELTRLTKVYGDVAGTSAEELGKIRKEVTETARELSATMGVGFNETIALAADIAATGKTGNELLGALTETTRLAVLGEVDRAEAMKATLAIQTAFKQNTEELSASINFLNAVENQTSTSLNDLVEAIPKAGPVVKQLGGDIQDLALYLTAMREGGINASESANALKSGLASLINPTKQTVGVMSDFGINILEMVNKNAGNTTSLLFDLQAALDNLDPLQKAQAIEQLFGKFQFARISALLNNLGRQGSQTLQVLDLMGESAGNLEAVAGRELAAVTESASGRYRRAIEGLKADLAGVGEQFLTISTNLINFVDGIVDFANKLPKPIKQALALVGGITAIAGPLIMLTGVLANFFGYIIKGLSHMRALFKGGEGFRLLTPEILAAERAGSLIEKTFYNDAQAASVLNTALKNLIDSFTVLQSKAAAGQFSVNPAVSTMAGNAIVASSAAGRVVDPNNPFLGRMGSRSSAHMNPRDPNNPATMFGLVPSTGPVNLKVGRNPMFYSAGDIPNIGGVTSFNKVSSGIYAPEAARWHALMATLGMQTRQEMENLKDTIAAGGTVSRDIMTTFDDILPLMSNVTDNAAKQTALIVAEMQAGKLTVAQARERIMALNAQVEAELVRTAQMFAASRGRTIDVTKVPGLDQPVVDLSGKSNMRELFHKGRSARMMEALGRATRTRMYGGPYNIETTRPQGLNDGEFVYMTNGQTVPGPNVNADVVPAMLTPGEFVLTRDVVAQQGSDAVEALHRGQAMIVPFGANQGGMVPKYINGGGVRSIASRAASLLSRRPTLSAGSITGNPASMLSLFGIKRRGTIGEDNAFIGPRGGKILSFSAKPATAVYGARLPRMPINPATGKPHTLESLNEAMARGGLRGQEIDAYMATLGYMSQGGPLIGTTTQFLNAIRINPELKSKILREIDDEFYKALIQMRNSNRALTDMNNPYHEISNRILNSYLPANSIERNYWNQFKIKTSGLNPLYASDLARGRGHSSSGGAQTIYLNGPDGSRIKVGKVSGGKGTLAFHARNVDWEKAHGFNRGGKVSKYRRGGGVVRNNRRYYGDYVGTPLRSQLDVAMARADALRPIPLSTRLGEGRGNINLTGIDVPYGPSSRLGKPMSPFMSNVLSMGAGTAGGMIGGQFGGMGGMIGFMAAQSAAASLLNKNMGSSINILSKLKTALIALPGPAKALAAVGALALAIKTVNDRINEHRRIVDQGFAPTSDTIDKLNLKFETTSESLNKANEAMLAVQATGAALAAKGPLGIPGVSLNIEEFNQLSERVKSDFPDLVEVFNKAKPDEVAAKAEQLKAQFVAGGMGAQEATDFIYTLIKASNDANLALSAISYEGFRSIKDAATAAKSSIETFQDLINLNNTDQIAEAFDTARTSINLMIKDLVGTKDATGNIITEAEALSIALNTVGEYTNNNEVLTRKHLNALEEIDPIMNSILNDSETLQSVYAKTELFVKGISAGLRSLSSEQAVATLAVFTEMESIYRSTEGPFAALAKTIKNLENNKAPEKIIKSVQRSQDEIKKEIDLRRKNIETIKEEADAKLDALNKEREDQDELLAIRKLQLQYQQQVSSGQLEAAAQTAIDIQRAVSNRQSELANRAIEDKANSRIKQEENAIEKLQAELDRSQKKIDAANKQAEKNANDLAKYQGIMSEVITAMTYARDGIISPTENQVISKLQEALSADPNKAIRALAPLINPNPAVETLKQGERGEVGLLGTPIEELFARTFGRVIKGDALQVILKETGLSEEEVRRAASGQGKFPVDISFDTRPVGKGIVRTPYVTESDLIAAGIAKTKDGWKNAKFKDDSGQKWIVTNTYDKVQGGWQIQKREKGGPVKANTPYIVGEKGPEIFTPFSNGKIISNEKSFKKYKPIYVYDTARFNNSEITYKDGKISYVYDGTPTGLASVYGGGDRYTEEERSRVIKDGIKYLNERLGVPFKLAKTDKQIANAVKINWAFPGTRPNQLGSSGKNLITLASPAKMNLFSFNRTGSKKTLLHEMIHALGADTPYASRKGKDPGDPFSDTHSGNPFDVMFKMIAPWPQFVNKEVKDIIQSRQKFHNWNGAVPGPYNQEIAATLKAGTEGVYQQSYIDSLKNDTMGSTIINVDKVVMKFPETPENGKQMFAEFKEAMRVENLKKGGTVRI